MTTELLLACLLLIAAIYIWLTTEAIHELFVRAKARIKRLFARRAIPHASHAVRELALLALQGPDPHLKLAPEIIRLVDRAACLGVNGQTEASLLASTVERLLMSRPLTPLTGAAEEWQDLSSPFPQRGPSAWDRQNIRDPRVYMDRQGRAVFTQAVIWREVPSDPSQPIRDFLGYVEGIASAQTISFPCLPESRHVEVQKALLTDSYEYRILSPAEKEHIMARINATTQFSETKSTTTPA